MTCSGCLKRSLRVTHGVRRIFLSLSLSLSLKLNRAGIPIGNLASQLFANIYLNEFDQFIKHDLKLKNYARYTDDFVIVADNPDYLKSLLTPIKNFLQQQLQLELHPQKVTIKKFRQGIDFLGYVMLPHHRILRAKTKKRMFRKLKQKIKDCREGIISEAQLQASFQSYLGIVSHSHSYRLSQWLKNYAWFRD